MYYNSPYKECTTTAYVKLCPAKAHIQAVYFNSPYKQCTTKAHSNCALQQPIKIVHCNSTYTKSAKKTAHKTMH